MYTEITCASPGFSCRLEKDKSDFKFSSVRARHQRPLSALDSSIRRLQFDLSVRHVLPFTLVLAISPEERGRLGKTLILAEVYTLLILISGSQMRTPRFVRVMNLNSKRNFDVNEPDYGLLSKLTISSPRLIRCLFCPARAMAYQSRAQTTQPPCSLGIPSRRCQSWLRPPNTASRWSPRSCDDWSFLWRVSMHPVF